MASGDVENHVQEITLIMVGKVGVGKSRLGCSILNMPVFRYESLSTSVTKECLLRATMVTKHHLVKVLDTPGLFNDGDSPFARVALQIKSSMDENDLKPHAFLVCFAIDRTTPSDIAMTHGLEAVFGPDVWKSTILVFTKSDNLEGKSFREFSSENEFLNNIMNKCGQRVCLIENGGENVVARRLAVKKILHYALDVSDRGTKHFQIKKGKFIEKMLETIIASCAGISDPMERFCEEVKRLQKYVETGGEITFIGEEAVNMVWLVIDLARACLSQTGMGCLNMIVTVICAFFEALKLLFKSRFQDSDKIIITAFVSSIVTAIN